MKKIISILVFITLMFFIGCTSKSSEPEFKPLPEDFQALRIIFNDPLDSIVYEISEKQEPENSDSVVTTKMVTLSYLGDSTVNGNSYWNIDLRLRSVEDQIEHYQENILVRLESAGNLQVAKRASGNSEPLAARMLPEALSAKMIYGGKVVSSLAKTLLNRSSESYQIGSFDFDREISGKDTLDFRENREESWTVTEKVSFLNKELMTATYWYGSSGLIKGEQVWSGIENRDGQGAVTGTLKLTRIFRLL